MAEYSRLFSVMESIPDGDAGDALLATVTPYLVDEWLAEPDEDYSDDVVETSVSGFSYLFDVGYERLIAAWGISRGRHTEKRDAARMAGHPHSAGKLYHRGHAIPHTLGGPTDLNLVPQLGRINIGPFRPLEKQAVATPGSLYFTHWLYRGAVKVRGCPGQMPTAVEQGLLVPGRPPDIRRHGN
jgi:hypothetical protein